MTQRPYLRPTAIASTVVLAAIMGGLGFACSEESAPPGGNGGNGGTADDAGVPEDSGTPGTVGRGCYLSSDCTAPEGCSTPSDGLPGGYCLIENCEAGTCPAGSQCATDFADGISRCVASCESDESCRQQEGYRCSAAGYCWPGEHTVPPGGSCGSDAQCSDEANGYCLIDNPGGWLGGYCVTLDCAGDSCPAGSKCVPSFYGSGVSACVADCSAPCRPGYLCNNDPGDALDQTCLPGCLSASDCPGGLGCDRNAYDERVCLSVAVPCDPQHVTGDCAAGNICEAGTCATFTCEADALEANNSANAAGDLPTGTTPNLTLCASDQDWYRFTPDLADTYYYVGKDAPYTTGDTELMLVNSELDVVDDANFVRDYEFHEESPVGPANIEAFGLIGATGSSPHFARVYPYQSGEENRYTLLVRTLAWKDGLDCEQAGFSRGDCRAQTDAGMFEPSKLVIFPAGNPADPVVGDGIEFNSALYSPDMILNPSSRRYARRDVIMIVRYAVSQVRSRFADTTPLSIGDIGIIDGRTPLGHPNYTHEDGANVDLSYYIRPENQHGRNNPVYQSICCDTVQPNWNACTSSQTFDCAEGAEATHTVDLPRTAHLLAKIAGSGRLRVYGVDVKVKPALIAELNAQAEASWISATERAEALAHMAASDDDASWLAHYNHMHLSFCTDDCGTTRGGTPKGPYAGMSVADVRRLWESRVSRGRRAPAQPLP